VHSWGKTGNKGNKNANLRNSNLSIKALKLPDALSLIINLIPPPQPNKYPSADILHDPEVKCCEEHSDDKDDDEVVHEQCGQYVERQCRCLHRETIRIS